MKGNQLEDHHHHKAGEGVKHRATHGDASENLQGEDHFFYIVGVSQYQ
jgi:hypothetical protein